MNGLRAVGGFASAIAICVACSEPDKVTPSASGTSSQSASPTKSSPRPSASVVTSSAPIASASASVAASADAAPLVSAPSRERYQPLPEVEACAECPWKGTGCVKGGEKKCALDPSAWWEVKPLRAKTTAELMSEGAEVCISGSTQQSACGHPTGKKEKDFDVLAPLKPETSVSIMSTADLVGLEMLSVSTPSMFGIGTFEKLTVDAALFEKGATIIGSDADEKIVVSIKPAAAPAKLPDSFGGRIPPETAASKKDPDGYKKAVELGKIAVAIDAKVAGYSRVVTIAHRESGFGIRLIGFYDGDKLVKALGELPYVPPTIINSYYFHEDRLIALHSMVYGVDESTNPSIDVSTSYYDEKQRLWSDYASFDPATREPAKPGFIFKETKKALKDPKYHLAEDTL